MIINKSCKAHFGTYSLTYDDTILIIETRSF